MNTLEELKKQAAAFLRYEKSAEEFMDSLCIAVSIMTTRDLERIAQALMREL